MPAAAGRLYAAAIRKEHQALLDLICGLELKPLPKSKPVPRWRELVIQMGKGADQAWHDLLEIIAFVGRGVSAVGDGLAHPRSLRPASISRQIAETGVNALPIIGVMSVMIAVVIGYQSVAARTSPSPWWPSRCCARWRC